MGKLELTLDEINKEIDDYRKERELNKIDDELEINGYIFTTIDNLVQRNRR